MMNYPSARMAHFVSIMIAVIAIGTIPTAWSMDADVNLINDLLLKHNAILNAVDGELLPLETGYPEVRNKLLNGIAFFSGQRQKFQNERLHLKPVNFAALDGAYSRTIQINADTQAILSQAPEQIAKERATIKLMKSNVALLRKAIGTVDSVSEAKSSLLYSIAKNLEQIKGAMSLHATFVQQLDQFVRQQQISWLNVESQVSLLKSQPDDPEMTNRISLHDKFLRADSIPINEAKKYRDNLEVILEGLNVVYDQQKSSLTWAAAQPK